MRNAKLHSSAKVHVLVPVCLHVNLVWPCIPICVKPIYTLVEIRHPGVRHSSHQSSHSFIKSQAFIFCLLKLETKVKDD